MTGCATDTGAPTTSAPATTLPQSTSETSANGDAKAWAEKVCASVAPEVAKLSGGPNIDPSNPEKARDGLVTYLDTLAGALDRMIGGVRDAGAPPVAEGQVAADRTISTLEEAKGAVESAKTRLAAADVSDPAAFQAAFVKVGEDLQKLSELEDPTAGLRGNAELDAAFREAESCKTLAGSDGSASATTPTMATSTTATATS
ncbi:hypothetical protein ACTG9Q_11650 [Actinokineospora sp. 24-640]